MSVLTKFCIGYISFRSTWSCRGIRSSVSPSRGIDFVFLVYRSPPLDGIAHSSVPGLSLGPKYTCSIFAAGFQGPAAACLASVRAVSETVSPRVAETCNDFLPSPPLLAPFFTLENKSSELDKIRRIAVEAIRVARRSR